jgi:hypothetical protein
MRPLPPCLRNQDGRMILKQMLAEGDDQTVDFRRKDFHFRPADNAGPNRNKARRISRVSARKTPWTPFRCKRAETGTATASSCTANRSLARTNIPGARSSSELSISISTLACRDSSRSTGAFRMIRPSKWRSGQASAVDHGGLPDADLRKIALNHINNGDHLGCPPRKSPDH